MQTITIEQTELPVIDIDGRRLVTLAMVDRVHQRPEGTAGRTFRRHRQRLVVGEDYIWASSDEIRRSNPGAIPDHHRNDDAVLLTESGYLMLVKSFTDDLAWAVQRQLVGRYFRGAPTAGPVDIDAAFEDPARLRAALLSYADRLLSLEARMRADAPKVAFHDAVGAAVNCQSIQEVAKVLGTGPVRLFRFLRDEGLLMPSNLPYQQYLDAGYFRVVERQYRDDRGEHHSYTRTLVTGKGLAYIQRRLQGTAPVGPLFALPAGHARTSSELHS